ncbi:SWI/SNF-related matrix-associated actin-dependent regulator of chromatin subfamily A-like protein 1 [Astathelohania contejeani]|uniref:SWI/SNF-related matrix-associated actin-dependent regulator of chromatin subfamily A-like protein 1 n=1 Tax=Astathelohania contejeani TaxID=164912 RepID=A0ABQ7HYR2_9MICR|nr:SWI/SNF-related matrix-associated actin-dependent regulator of chromatin subfamily A-like protein 1 [Thelohania contejeani]
MVAHKLFPKYTYSNKKDSRIKLFITQDGLIRIQPSNKTIASVLTRQSDPNIAYDLETNSWTFSVQSYEVVREELKKSKMEFTEIPKGALNILRKTIPSENFVLNESVYATLLPFQKEGVRFALNRNGRIILADDMGLGKTFQALAIAYYYRLEWPLLIIAPASLLENWSDAVSYLLKEECIIVRSKSEFGNKISVISYDTATKHSEILVGLSHRVIIVDECHYLKSNTSKRTTTLVPLIQRATRAILLSGTPALSRPIELFPIISAVNNHIFPNFKEYGMRYCAGRKIGHWYDYKGSSNSEELFHILKKSLLLRRTKDEVLNELPRKFRRQVLLALKTEVQTKSMDLIMQQYKEAGELKVEGVKEYITNLLEKKIKFLVFAHHQSVLDELEEFIIGTGVGFIKIDGRTAGNQRQSLCNIFQENDSVRIALLGLTACSTGLTLTAGKAVVFAELYWNPGTLLQAEDRIHRIGQVDNVDIHYIIAKGTIDELVWPKLIKKLHVLESLGIGNNELKKVKEISINQEILDDLGMLNRKI